MTLEEAARSELLQIRKHRDGVTVAALARTEAIRQVLGGGDPRVAYNTLKHILLSSSDDLGVTAASYSLGFASDGTSHLDRLTDFGLEHGYDQRQARRYSDRGVRTVASHIGSEWVLEASPVMRLSLVAIHGGTAEALLQALWLPFIEMREPKVELVTANGARAILSCTWTQDASPEGLHRITAHVHAEYTQDEEPTALSILWAGELWPKFELTTPRRSRDNLRIEALAARLQVRPVLA